MKQKAFGILIHAVKIVRRNVRSYALLSVTIILSLSALLLCGCSGESSQNPTEETTIPTGASSTAAVDYLQNVTDLAQQRMPVYDEAPVIEFDPDRRIYVHVPKLDADLFYSEPHPLWVYSLDPLDPEQIQLHIDCQTAYTMEYVGDYSKYCRVKEREAEMLPDLALQEFQYYSMQGVNWQELALLKAQAKAAYDLGLENVKEPEISRAYRAIYEDFQQRYEETAAEYHKQYEALTTEDIPQFYLYRFQFSFPGHGAYEETVESAKLIIGSETYPIDLGQLRLHKSVPQIFTGEAPFGLSNVILGKSALRCFAYNGSYTKVAEMYSFDTETDLTVTGMSQLTCGTEIQILAARVRIQGQADYFWDMQRPIEVAAGTHVDIDLYLKDARWEEYHPRITTYFLLDYTVGQENHVLTVNACFEPIISFWDIYLMAFEGIDMGEYYTYMVTPYSNGWLNELPEEWLE